MPTKHSGPLAAIFCLTALCCFAESPVKRDDVPQGPASSAALDQAALEKDFARKLTGAALVGTFTVDGQPADKAPNPERYELESVSKLKNGHWMFVSRIKYGDHDVKVPLALKVLWAGDTPMISLTDFTIPGMGTFTARVMFHGDRYAGTWQHGAVGGHMWGRIEQAGPASKDDDAPAKDDAAKEK